MASIKSNAGYWFSWLERERVQQPTYSSICLSFMAHTAKMNWAVPSAQPISAVMSGRPINPVQTNQFIVVVKYDMQPRMNRIQAVIDARALKIGGIFPSFWFYTATSYNSITLIVKIFVYRAYGHSIEVVVKLNLRVRIKGVTSGF